MVAVAILAAGKGTRMKSDLPKVLHPLGGRSLVERVIESCALIKPERICTIVGYRAAEVKTALAHLPHLEFVEQTEQLGTGHAVQQLLEPLKDFVGDVVILNGDVPLLRPETIADLVSTHQKNNNDATLLTAQLPNPTGYGRVFCDGDNLVTQIVEHRDCNDAQRKNNRINAGVYCFKWEVLAEALPKLTTNNDQQEYYLTDVILHCDKVMAMDVADFQEISGINDRFQLSAAYEILQDRIKEKWMKAGVMIHQPDTVTIDDTVQLEPDVMIEPQTHLRGNSLIKTGCRLGPGSLIENSVIEANTTILYSVVSDSQVGENAQIGPYTHIRGQAKVGEQCRIGNFVEVKKSTIGNNTNMAHLSYIGDATLGAKVNIGAGTITANYDGVNKHQTVIGDRSKTGANSVLVAPITIGEDVTIAAGSTITKDVDNDCLVVARARQKEIKGWRLQS
ncbi:MULTISPECIES: bifunctional UDP-N-acetylglucosamine diphosphorylase/glucosamine-1-phosphate N-acetyltransferase GlmU [unclassified Picosynechococcus]|uniref:bifunctional UDP-N-acetylglucosamine diphosphorylase/glucosamine-1-phosphate N-acetyltransferase GlmU n=1 Tax=unclassified Picosynechococcus TaxID=3079910 RepID=UPI00074590DD|nr:MULTISPECIES: bifunctional UDP-N-acetylglucosamine diphosphorylase/glucosamine-1-phosphate N-acetyltransferase GlmU [unclassified Picosynechococcus]AMA10186.1 bifunctional N-acetylglucosamine-1-phosphate uridyltransferase/glucosamine-1-phosphate acetyltransferase [Picosynechococcus sp. PCC 73109]QCS48459.1 bifunctional UDP-N-acetylglucosamine diphosphorylase/glucosamine-1-phosphate N-acetyltransferase GlmU [Picosynechococcus sp. PCC 11901]